MSLGRLPQTGRRPRKPKTVDARLDQLVKDSDAWVRLFREVWFDPSDPLIEDAIGASEQPELSDQYDTAIDAIRWVAACAEVAEDKLKSGKRKAQKKLKDASE
jgi:hypothetical protein